MSVICRNMDIASDRFFVSICDSNLCVTSSCLQVLRAADVALAVVPDSAMTQAVALIFSILRRFPDLFVRGRLMEGGFVFVFRDHYKFLETIFGA